MSSDDPTTAKQADSSSSPTSAPEEPAPITSSSTIPSASQETTPRSSLRAASPSVAYAEGSDAADSPLPPWKKLVKQGMEVFESLFKSGASVDLAARFRAGQMVCAVCPTTEDEKGYWIVLVVDAIRDANRDSILKLVKLTSTHENREDQVGSTFTYLSEHQGSFWEQESRLLYVPTRLKRDADGREVIVILKGIDQVLGVAPDDDGSIISSETARSPSRVLSFMGIDHLELFHYDDDSDVTYKTLVDLDSKEGIEESCERLISTFAERMQLEEGPINQDKNGWKFVEVNNDLEIFTRMVGKGNYVCFMSRAMIDASPTEIKYLIKQSTNREQFDPMCRGIRVVETLDEDTAIAHFVDSKYLLNREFCVLRHDFTTPDQVVYLVSNSVQTPKYPSLGFTRGVVVNSGFKLEPKGKGFCLMSYSVQVDLRVWLPSFVIDRVVKAQVFEVLERIRDYFQGKSHYESTMNPM